MTLTSENDKLVKKISKLLFSLKIGGSIYLQSKKAVNLRFTFWFVQSSKIAFAKYELPCCHSEQQWCRRYIIFLHIFILTLWIITNTVILIGCLKPQLNWYHETFENWYQAYRSGNNCLFRLIQVGSKSIFIQPLNVIFETFNQFSSFLSFECWNL